MKNLEEKKDNGVFQTFDLEKFFDKESLIDTMDTLKKRPRSPTRTTDCGTNLMKTPI